MTTLSYPTVLAIDPGNTQSGWCVFDGLKVQACGVDDNDDIRFIIMGAAENYPGIRVAMEMIASYGMPVGRDVFETCVWIGRFYQTAKDNGMCPKLIYRKDVKMEICGTTKAKDGNIRQAIIDRVGPPGTKKKPGPTYGCKTHIWAALGVAITDLASIEIAKDF